MKQAQILLAHSDHEPRHVEGIRVTLTDGTTTQMESLLLRDRSPETMAGALRHLADVLEGKRPFSEAAPSIKTKKRPRLLTYFPPPDWRHGLSIVAGNSLHRIEATSKESVLEAIKERRLAPNVGRPRGYGWKAHEEVCAWLGLPPPIRGRRRKGFGV